MKHVAPFVRILLTLRVFTLLLFAPACVFAGVIVNATVGYSSPDSFGFVDTTCSMNSGGAPIMCPSGGGFLVAPPAAGPNIGAASSASSTASFDASGAFLESNATADTGGGAVTGDAHSSANASYDEWVLIPGSGTATVTGDYSYTVMYNITNGLVASVTQAGMLQLFPFNLTDTGYTGTATIQSNIQLGVPFEVTGMLSTGASAGKFDFGGPDLGEGTFSFTGFTDSTGRSLAFEIVPEPELSVLSCFFLAAVIIIHRKKARLRNGYPVF